MRGLALSDCPLPTQGGRSGRSEADVQHFARGAAEARRRRARTNREGAPSSGRISYSATALMAPAGLCGYWTKERPAGSAPALHPKVVLQPFFLSRGGLPCRVPMCASAQTGQERRPNLVVGETALACSASGRRSIPETRLSYDQIRPGLIVARCQGRYSALRSGADVISTKRTSHGTNHHIGPQSHG